MARVTIPLQGDRDQQLIELPLDGVTYRLVIRWNSQLGLYVFDLRDAADVALIAGVGLAANQDLLSPWRNLSSAIPAGVLMLVDLLGLWAEATKADLGGRWVLVYEEAA